MGCVGAAADVAAVGAPGGGGSGAIPTTAPLSLAAAAAAAEAYFNVSPGGLAGGGAGFIEEVTAPFGTVP